MWHMKRASLFAYFQCLSFRLSLSLSRGDRYLSFDALSLRCTVVLHILMSARFSTFPQFRACGILATVVSQEGWFPTDPRQNV